MDTLRCWLCIIIFFPMGRPSMPGVFVTVIGPLFTSTAAAPRYIVVVFIGITSTSRPAPADETFQLGDPYGEIVHVINVALLWPEAYTCPTPTVLRIGPKTKVCHR